MFKAGANRRLLPSRLFTYLFTPHFGSDRSKAPVAAGAAEDNPARSVPSPEPVPELMARHKARQTARHLAVTTQSVIHEGAALEAAATNFLHTW